MLAVDTETTGVDFHHGSRPFFVTMYGAGGHEFWHWDVDPYTRNPSIPKGDLGEIRDRIFGAEKLVFQNPKFDLSALRSVGGLSQAEIDGLWGKTVDTLFASHLLASNQPHDLTTLALVYLGVNIQPLEDKLRAATIKARAIAKREFPKWKLTKKGNEDSPSTSDKIWKQDTFLPKLIAQELGYEEWHEFWTVLEEYANADSLVTWNLYDVMLKKIRERGYEKIYESRLKVLPVGHKMETVGITGSMSRHKQITQEYMGDLETLKTRCVNLAGSFGHELNLPKSGNNKSLLSFCFDQDKLALPVLETTDTGNPSLSKSAIEKYRATLPQNSKGRAFVGWLSDIRSRSTALLYLSGYERFWLPTNSKGFFRLFPSLNPTGTATLRWSCKNPNEQNISKREGFNLRYCFGPLPGRVWFSLDAKNIELRIPAYEANERAMIELFEHPDEPPYYGSNHLLAAHILHPERFEKCVDDAGRLDGRIFKKLYASTWYQWVKNGNFAVQYGAMEESGTADAAYHVIGGQALIKERFSAISELNEKMIGHAEQFGYVETIPDKTVDPDRGYPLFCTRSNWGKILPTVPLNYHVQGSAMWWMCKAMVRCQDYLDQINENRREEDKIHLIMQVHDELVFDFPCDYSKIVTQGENFKHVKKLQSLMEEGGNDISIPTPVSIEYHPENWSVGISL